MKKDTIDMINKIEESGWASKEAKSLIKEVKSWPSWMQPSTLREEKEK